MRLICFWCFILAAAVKAQDGAYYAPQTFRQNVGPVLFNPQGLPNLVDSRWTKVDAYGKSLFSPALPTSNDVAPQGSVSEQWRPRASPEPWGVPASLASPAPSPAYPKPEPWRLPYPLTTEQQASILHHKQALTSEGAFRFEYASDNGLSAGEVIEPDGSRVGAYQYKDPNGQLVKLKYRAGKDGFQILEGSHLPKSPEPVAPQTQDTHYMTAYEQQRRQYELQQQYNQQRPQAGQTWRPEQESQNQNGAQSPAGGQYFTQNWKPGTPGEDDGQYRENDVEDKGPHSFGEGYSFAFQG